MPLPSPPPDSSLFSQQGQYPPAYDRHPTSYRTYEPSHHFTEGIYRDDPRYFELDPENIRGIQQDSNDNIHRIPGPPGVHGHGLMDNVKNPGRYSSWKNVLFIYLAFQWMTVCEGCIFRVKSDGSDYYMENVMDRTPMCRKGCHSGPTDSLPRAPCPKYGHNVNITLFQGL